jgi:tRNA dimethylallyltransferase
MADPIPDLIIAGPTASGKTDLALRVAQRIHGEIIGADAFQIYRDLPLITAQPDTEQKNRVPHFLVGEIAPSEPFDVSQYCSLAKECIRAIQARGKRAILVGGTGLYIRAILRGFSKGLPGPNPLLRAELEQKPLVDLVQELIQLDPGCATGVDLQNPRRVIRALEVCLLTGKPFTSFRTESPSSPSTPQHGFWISMARSELHQRIATRTQELFRKGVLEEVESMADRLGPTASQAIGIREIQAHLRGELTREETIQKITEATRQYARRQETWFRKETSLCPISPGNAVRVAEDMVRGAGFEPATSCV